MLLGQSEGLAFLRTLFIDEGALHSLELISRLLFLIFNNLLEVLDLLLSPLHGRQQLIKFVLLDPNDRVLIHERIV